MTRSDDVIDSPDPEQPTDRAQIGERLRRIRRLRGLTLQKVATQVDLSGSFLSMLERGQADISLSRFTRLASFYGVRASDLLLEKDATTAPELSILDDALQIERGDGVTYRLLTPGEFGAQAIHVRFEPRSGFKDVLAHRGRDYCWVLKGEVVLIYGDDEYVVRRSQLISYDATTPHAVRNDSDRPAEIIAFVTPPYW